uniref:Uncharacterized protein n=1 Tax=Nelumbo nucifera TaxID=4432 RepID=A0A822XWL6_NELNU|nr:TPA_asm: hypothetical protein HUJ06_026181 [Nelumbo nucifera]
MVFMFSLFLFSSSVHLSFLRRLQRPSLGSVLCFVPSLACNFSVCVLCFA